MKRRLPWLLALVVVGLAIWVWRIAFPPDSILIRRLVEKAARAASNPGNEGDLGRLTRSAELRGFCTEDILIRVDISGRDGTLEGREAVFAAVQNAANALGVYEVRILELGDPSISGDSGTVSAALSLEGGASREIQAQEFRITVRKLQGKWRLAKVETVRALRK